MFNLFKRNIEDPSSKVFADLSFKQKMSIFNFLTAIAVCDASRGNQDREVQCLNAYINILGVRNVKCTEYIELEGYTRMLEDLKTLSQSQKEFLVIAAFEVITCDAKPNETELRHTAMLFEQIGVDEKKIIAIINKSELLMKEFLRR